MSFSPLKPSEQNKTVSVVVTLNTRPTVAVLESMREVGLMNISKTTFFSNAKSHLKTVFGEIIRKNIPDLKALDDVSDVSESLDRYYP